MDKFSSKFLAEKLGLLSVNQINAQVKISEMWKALNSDSKALKLSIKTKDSDAATTRSDRNVVLLEHGLTEVCKKTLSD